jgi:hypothetical protein
LKTSQFRRDAERTIKFLEVYRKDLNVTVRWADAMPPSLLIWTDECALVEPYDYGHQESILVGCIGRTAPLMVVAGGTDYHSALKASFDYVFDGKNAENLPIFAFDEVWAAVNIK